MEETAVTANLKGTKARFAEVTRTKVVFKSPVEEESTVETMDRLLQEPELAGLADLVVQAYSHGHSFRDKVEQKSVFTREVIIEFRHWIGQRDLENDLTPVQMLFLLHWCYLGADMREQADGSKKAYEKELAFKRCVPNQPYAWPSIAR